MTMKMNTHIPIARQDVQSFIIELSNTSLFLIKQINDLVVAKEEAENSGNAGVEQLQRQIDQTNETVRLLDDKRKGILARINGTQYNMHTLKQQAITKA